MIPMVKQSTCLGLMIRAFYLGFWISHKVCQDIYCFDLIADYSVCTGITHGPFLFSWGYGTWKFPLFSYAFCHHCEWQYCEGRNTFKPFYFLFVKTILVHRDTPRPWAEVQINEKTIRCDLIWHKKLVGTTGWKGHRSCRQRHEV